MSRASARPSKPGLPATYIPPGYGTGKWSRWLENIPERKYYPSAFPEGDLDGVDPYQWEVNRAIVKQFARTIQPHLVKGVPIDLLFNAFYEWFEENAPNLPEAEESSFWEESHRSDIMVAVFVDVDVGYVKRAGKIVAKRKAPATRPARSKPNEPDPPAILFGTGSLAPPRAGKDLLRDMSRLRAKVTARPGDYLLL